DNSAQFSRLFHMSALALMMSSGAHLLILSGLTRSFTALPIGGAIDLASSAESIVMAVSEMFLAAVQIAGPLLVVLFLADVGLGLLTRVAPALNAFALGFPLKIFLTLTLAVTVFAALPTELAILTVGEGDTLMGVKKWPTNLRESALSKRQRSA